MKRLLLPSTLPTAPQIGALADALNIHPAHALGLMVACYLGVKQHRKDGIVTTAADDTLEAWAQWRGRRGRFAPEFRRIFVRPSGRLRWWGLFNGGHLNNRKPISDGVRALVFLRDDGRCRRCGCPDDLQLDHVHPRSRGGTDHPDNLQLLCGPCNREKGARV